jgi:hypothetical protein
MIVQAGRTVPIRPKARVMALSLLLIYYVPTARVGRIEQVVTCQAFSASIIVLGHSPSAKLGRTPIKANALAYTNISRDVRTCGNTRSRRDVSNSRSASNTRVANNGSDHNSSWDSRNNIDNSIASSNWNIKEQQQHQQEQ